MDRRGFMESLAAGFALGNSKRRTFARNNVQASPSASTPNEAQQEPSVIEARQIGSFAPQSIKMLEPLKLAGKRLFFQNWYYVRQGFLGWVDEGGRAVDLRDAVPPGAATLKHKDQPVGIRLVAQEAQRIGPLLEPDRPWEEGAGVGFDTVIKDGGMYRAWSTRTVTSGEPPGTKYYCYFESSDGLTWKRPKVGQLEIHGSRDNNILNIDFGSGGSISSDSSLGDGSIFVDPSAPPAERYKFLAHARFSGDVCKEYLRQRPNDWDPIAPQKEDGSGSGLAGGVSPDGLHWTLFRDPLVIEFTDTQVIAYYDQALKKYVAYTRTWVGGSTGRRSIGRSETSDYRKFPLHETILEPGPELAPSDTLYYNGKTTMPGAPDHHLLFPTIWHTANDGSTIMLASSHDGKLWHFFGGSSMLRPAPFGAFDGGVIFSHPNLVELPDGSFALPYTGFSVPHKYPRKMWKYAPGYAVWPRGRLIALAARERGEFTTVGIVPPGRTARINALTRRGGSITVEVGTLDGTPLPGHSFADARPIVGDHHWTTLSWRGKEDLGHRGNEGIVLRFRLDQAEIYGLEFA
jgi:hypothetical protein